MYAAGLQTAKTTVGADLALNIKMGSDMDFNQALQKGIHAAKAGNSLLAQLHLREAVELEPGSVDCWLWLAWVAESPESTRLSLERVLELHPDHQAAQAGMSWIQCLNDCSSDDQPAESRCHTDTAELAEQPENDDFVEHTSDSLVDSEQRTADVERLPVEPQKAHAQDQQECEVDEQSFSEDSENLTCELPTTEEESDESPVDETPSLDESARLTDPEDECHSDAECDSCFTSTSFADEASDYSSTEPAFCSAFPDEYCIQEAVVASVDAQFELLLDCDQLLDRLDSNTENDVEPARAEEVTQASSECHAESELEAVDELERVELEEFIETTEPTDVEPACCEDVAQAPSECHAESELEVVDQLELVVLEEFSETTEPTDVKPACSEEVTNGEPGEMPVGGSEESGVGHVDELSSLEEIEGDVCDAVGFADDEAGGDDGRPVIVVCDDSPTIRKLVSMSLEPHGFRVLTAENGAEGCRLIQRVLPTLVLSDINMPEMDGYQLCKSVTRNQLTRNIPVVMLSGKDGVFDKLRGKLVGSSDHMSKPFSPQDLLRCVRKHVCLETIATWSN